MPIQYVFRTQQELADYLQRLANSARSRGETDVAYGFEQAAMLVEQAKFEGAAGLDDA